MYGVPPEVSKPGCSLKEIVQHRAKIGLFSGNVDDYVAKILSGIVERKPSVNEIELADGRVVRVSERAMDGGGGLRPTRTSPSNDGFNEYSSVPRSFCSP